jgi:putative membrane protein
MEEAQELNEDKKLNEDDARFATKAAESGMKEVELSKMAVNHAASADVKSFAQMMVDDHSKVNAELKSLAESKQITIPVALTDETKKAMDDLTKKSGTEFDKEYMDKMVKDHKDAVDLFEKASRECKDGDLKNFASTHLPHLRTHLELAEKTHKSLKDAKKK